MVLASRWFQKQERAQVVIPAEASDVLALGYVRVSSKGPEGRSSPAVQRHDIGQYVRRHGWQAGEVFSDVLQGWRTDRAGYLRLRAEIQYQRQQGQAVAVIATNIDRTGRVLEETLAFARELRALGVELHLVDDNGTLTDDQRTFKGWMAEQETKKLQERVGRSKRAVARAGLPATGAPPWGYLWRLPLDEAEGRRHKLGSGPEVRRILDINEDEAPSAREFFARFAAGERTGTLKEWAASLPEAARGGRSLGMSGLLLVLRNPAYVARRVHPAVLAELGLACDTPEDVLALPKSTHWPALIVDATWLAAQHRLRDKKRTRRGPPASFLLTGPLRCPVCSAPMGGGSSKVSGRHYPNYRCMSGELGAGKTDLRCNFSAARHLLDDAVLAEVGAVLEKLAAVTPRLLPEVRREWAKLQREAVGAGDEHARKVARLQQQLATTKRALAEALAKRLTSEDEAEEYEGAAAVLREKRRGLEVQLAQMGGGATLDTAGGPALPDLDEVLAAAGGWSRMLREGSVAEQRAVLLELVERVTPHRVTRGQYTVELTWAPGWDALHELAKSR